MKNILIYETSYKNFMNSKLLSIWFHRIDGFVINSDGIRYLVILSNIVGLIKYVVLSNIF